MEYRIKRGEQLFGPYSLSDLQQYVQQGNISKDDLAQSETMSEWLPVGQILGDIPVPLQPAYAGAAGFAAGGAVAVPGVKLPPNLPWPVLLVAYLSYVPYLKFFSFFAVIWAFVLANWARKLNGKNTALVLVSMNFAGLFSGAFIAGIAVAVHAPGIAGVGGLLIIAGIICLIAGVFAIRGAMEEYYNSVENIGLGLSGVMTFFFGVIYIQYHVNRIARMKQNGEIA